MIIVILLLILHIQGFELTRSVDRTSLQLGELLTLTLTAERDKNEKLLFPAPDASFGDFELRDMRAEQEEKNGRIIEKKQYSLQVFKLGTVVVPQLVVILATDTAIKKLTDSVSVIVKSSLLPSDTADIQDIHGPLSLPLSRLFWVVIVLVVVLLIVSLLLFDRFVRKRRKVFVPPPPPPEPPLNVFNREIEGLISAHHLDKGEVKEFHLKLSEILRRFLGARYNFEALESTTTELSQMLKSKGVDAAVMRKLDSFASINDPVKFAKWIPTNDISEALVDAAREIVAATTESKIG